MHKIVLTSLRSVKENAGKLIKDFNNTFFVLSVDASIADERPHKFVVYVLLVFLNCNLLYRLFVKV